MSLIDDEEWKYTWGFPNYKISSWGRVQSLIGTPKIQKGKLNGSYHESSISRKKELAITHPIAHYHKISEGVEYKTTFRIQITTHKLVMWHFRPIDNHPEDIGLSMTEWLSLSHRAREIIKHGLQINHKDHDPSNNKLSNLEWCTTIENNQAYRDSDKFVKVMASNRINNTRSS